MQRQNVAAWYVCEGQTVWINLGAYAYGTPAACADQTVSFADLFLNGEMVKWCLDLLLTALCRSIRMETLARMSRVGVWSGSVRGPEMAVGASSSGFAPIPSSEYEIEVCALLLSMI